MGRSRPFSKARFKGAKKGKGGRKTRTRISKKKTSTRVPGSTGGWVSGVGERKKLRKDQGKGTREKISE